MEMPFVLNEASITVDGEEVSLADFLKQQNVEFKEVEDNSESEDEDESRPVGPHGFPEETPVKDMTDAEKAAYYKYQNRKTEKRLADAQSAQSDASAVDAARAAGLAAGLSVAAESELARRLGVEPDALKPVLSRFPEGALVKDGKVDADALEEIAGMFSTFGGGATPPEGEGDADAEEARKLAANFGSQGTQKGAKGVSVNASYEAEKARLNNKSN